MPSIGELTHRLLAPLIQKKPILQLIMHWPHIVGNDISAMTRPHKWVEHPPLGTILWVKVKPAFEMEGWSMIPTMIERVNQYLGARTVYRIRLMRDQSSEN